jgi:hypothetical protein
MIKTKINFGPKTHNAYLNLSLEHLDSLTFVVESIIDFEKEFIYQRATKDIKSMIISQLYDDFDGKY